MSSKLPVGEIFKKSVSLVWERRAFALWISWPYAVVTVLVVAIGTSFFATETALPVPVAPGAPDAGPAPATSSAPTPYGGLSAAVAFTQGLFLCILAVYWHRNVLLQEMDAPALPLRFDAPVRRYIGYVMLLALAFVAIAGLATGVSLNLVHGPVVERAPVVVFVTMTAIAACLLLFRGCLALPAAAAGDRETGLRESWRLTRGNTLRMLALQLTLIAAAAGVSLIVVYAAAALGEAGVWVRFSANFIVNWAFSLVWLTMLSLIYAWLKHEAPPPDASM